MLLKNLFFQTSDNDPIFFLSLLPSSFHEGIKSKVNTITKNIKILIPPKIHLHPKIGNKI